MSYRALASNGAIVGGREREQEAPRERQREVLSSAANVDTFSGMKKKTSVRLHTADPQLAAVMWVG